MNMGYYEAAWTERKHFLATSSIIGMIISLVTTILSAAGGMFEGMEGAAAGGFIVFFILFSILFIPVVTIVRMMGGKAEGFAIGMLSGLWTSMLSSIFDWGPGMVIGMIEFCIFGILFSIVALGYAVYLPVSSIYYFIKYKQETHELAA